MVARLPPRGARERTLVLVAHHDAARTGLAWHPRIAAAQGARNRRRRRIEGFQQPTALGFLLVALGGWRLRRAGRALLALSVAADLDIARSPTVPGASDNATGVAAVLALTAELARDRPPGLEIVALCTGSEESGMGGMAAYLRGHDLPRPCLVLGLDTLGAGAPIVASGEGTILEHGYRDEDLALVPPEVERWRIGGWTDPVLARFAGLPAISLLSMGADGYLPNYHVPTDTPDRVSWDSVDACLDVARRTIAGFAASSVH